MCFVLDHLPFPFFKCPSGIRLFRPPNPFPPPEHTRIETTQLYAQIRPAVLKQAMDFYEAKALDVLTS